MYDFLRKVSLFAHLPQGDLERLCGMIDEVQLPAGQRLFAEGSSGDRAYIIKSGELEITKTCGRRQILLAVCTIGDVIGEMALLEEAPRAATVSARSDAVLYALNQEDFNRLIKTSPSASRVLLNTVLARWRSTEASLRHSEKMAQLGTLTAGVAHELINPATAVKRASGQLDEVLGEYADALNRLTALDLKADQKTTVEKLEATARQAALLPDERMDPLERNDRVTALETWLDLHGVHDAWNLAPTLVDLGYGHAELETLTVQSAADQLPAIAAWLCASATLHRLLAEIGQGSARISEIVKALKSYAYLDQAPVQEVNVHAGLDDTLLILRHKLAGIRLLRAYASDLPPIQAYGSELNQVWTNLIDNAIDALENTPEPQIVIRTRSADNWISVEIEDNGPGIPSEIQARIFDPFFTTKPPGKGTGLGLEIAYNIVVNKHLGDIRVSSRPGNTTFRVDLPVDFGAGTPTGSL